MKIKRVNWCKVIHHIFFLKHKCLELQIVSREWYKWYLTGRWERKQDHPRIGIEGEIFGLWFDISITDYRHWNETENRFYFSEEPELWWIGKNYSEQQYWKDIEHTMQAHPELGPDYYERCKQAYATYERKRRKSKGRSKI